MFVHNDNYGNGSGSLDDDDNFTRIIMIMIICNAIQYV